ncbi:MAG: 30S ribosomal protein S4 [bacterium]|nr:30S ribosomal protein S4 [bacterium]MCZ6700925.1 30S ribosomal protein S4 [bacterium]MDV2478994.1 30S ribosomal protein S4 [bacterium]
MARYIDSVCKLCRREGMKLFLKGERCLSDKCAFERRSYGPGVHGQRQRKQSEYGVRLREKQKVKRLYGLLEKQFRNYYHRAARQKGITGENLLRLLERRLDNVVYRLGLAHSRKQARQLVRHNHLLVNGRKVNIPSYIVNQGDKVAVKEKSRKLEAFLTALERVDARGVPAWLEIDREQARGVVLNLPAREDIDQDIQEQLIIELYSK